MNKFIFIVLCLALIVLFGVAIYNVEEREFRVDLNSNLWSSFFAAILFTILIFIINDIFFKVSINGEWKIKEKIEGPSDNLYVGYEIDFVFHLIQTGEHIHGFGEKTSQLEGSSGVFTKFERAKRVRVEISGYIDRSYLSKTKISMLIYEKGRERDTSSFFYLVYKKNSLTGKFTSTAGDAKGTIEMILVDNFMS